MQGHPARQANPAGKGYPAGQGHPAGKAHLIGQPQGHPAGEGPPAGQAQGGRKARNTYLAKGHVHGIGTLDGDADWNPHIESDGFTTFWGEIEFDTGYAPWVQALMVGSYAALAAAATAGHALRSPLLAWPLPHYQQLFLCESDYILAYVSTRLIL